MSFHKDTKGLIEEAVQKEYENAIAVDEKQHKGRYYNTLHEGYGMLLEEMWEAKDDFLMATRGKKHLLVDVMCGCTRDVYEDMKKRIQFSMEAMMELAQIAAVCQKMIDTIEKDNPASE